MGIRGLTTYITKRSDRYLEPYELHDTYLVIDGNSLASQLYCNRSKCNSAFGGDYDLYANCIATFFRMLKKCNISPLVILDGGYELRKWSTVKSRLRKKIISAGTVTPVTQSRIKSFPLMMKEVFKDVLKELEVPCVQSLYEADDEIAAIARQLDCPVLSYDSDYYVYDVLYIPFDTFSFEPSSRYCSDGSAPYYISCKIYKVEKFLHSFGGLQKSLLPLMAALLGNDYIKKSVFSNFLSQIKRPRSRTMNDTQKSIAGLLQWLRQETFETATSKILKHLKKNERKYVADQIQRIFAGYVQCSSNLLPLLGFHPVECRSSNEDIMAGSSVLDYDFEMRGCEEGEMVGVESQSQEVEKGAAEVGSDSEKEKEEEEEEEEELEEFGEEEGSDFSDNELIRNMSVESEVSFPPWFLTRFQQGDFSSCLIDMITHKTYFMSPQVDDSSLRHSHAISLPVIQVIFGLLVAHQGLSYDVCLTYYARDSYGQPKKFTLSPLYRTATVSFPKLDNLPDLPTVKRELILLECLNFDSEDKQAFEDFPPQWRLFLISLVFWARNCTEPLLTNCHIGAILCSLIALNLVDSQAGYFRSRKVLMKKQGPNLKKILNSRCLKLDEDSCKNKETINITNKDALDEESHPEQDLTKILSSVSIDDCLLLVETFFPFHQIEEKLKGSIKLYSTITVHAFAQFESCLFHIMQLNALLGFPFLHCQVAHFYSGMFVYNAFANFKKRSDALAYIMLLISQAPSVRVLFKKLYLCVMDLLPNISTLNKCTRRRRKGKVKHKTCGDEEEVDGVESNTTSEEEFYIDSNNKFSALSLES
ncbi:protein asteroid [Anabrus simplex]|uniref:protein asteroid n=1 Tax=Anabrus simplex TaxID=316456 RepID=UPI0035A36904